MNFVEHHVVGRRKQKPRHIVDKSVDDDAEKSGVLSRHAHATK